MRGALRHPFGLALLIASLLLAGAMWFLPALEPWSAQAPWVLLLGLLAYAAAVAVVHRRRPVWEPSSGSEDNGPKAAADEDHRRDSEDFPRLVQEALRHLNNPSALSNCELPGRLPGTLAPNRSQFRGHGGPSEPTPLEKAQALREVLIAAIDRLRPSGETIGSVAPQALQYHILHEAYVQRKPTSYIMTRYSISESTLHRNRRDAVSAVARHLQAQEAQSRQMQMQTKPISSAGDQNL